MQKVNTPLNLISGKVTKSGSDAVQKLQKEKRMSSAGKDREVPV